MAWIAALYNILGKIDAVKKSRRNTYFTGQIKKGFRGKPGNIVVLAEGDSWFNYPVSLV